MPVSVPVGTMQRITWGLQFVRRAFIKVFECPEDEIAITHTGNAWGTYFIDLNDISVAAITISEPSPEYPDMAPMSVSIYSSVFPENQVAILRGLDAHYNAQPRANENISHWSYPDYGITRWEDFDINSFVRLQVINGDAATVLRTRIATLGR